MTPTERKLNQEFRKLAQAGPLEAPPRLEQKLLAAFRKQRRRRAILRWGSLGGVVGTIAAAVMLLAVFKPVSSVPSATHGWQPVAITQETADFVALPDADTDAPLEYATIVRVQLPLYALRDIGLTVNEQSATDRVQADVVLGQDGLARAVRFVQ